MIILSIDQLMISDTRSQYGDIESYVPLEFGVDFTDSIAPCWFTEADWCIYASVN